jgi:hypothetical protein
LLILVACGGSSAPPSIDADVEPGTGCPETPADPSAPGAFTVFLATEGVALTTGCNSSATNCTTILPADATIPPVFSSEPARDAVIAEIVDLARSRLVPYSVDLVTTRPSTGVYNMIVFGGDAVTVGLPNSPVSAAPFNCNNTPDDRIALLFDRGIVDVTATDYANQVLFQIATMEGLTFTQTSDDCQCQLDAECANTGALCTFSSAPTSTMVPTCGRTIQDGPALLKEAFGCR